MKFLFGLASVGALIGLFTFSGADDHQLPTLVIAHQGTFIEKNDLGNPYEALGGSSAAASDQTGMPDVAYSDEMVDVPTSPEHVSLSGITFVVCRGKHNAITFADKIAEVSADGRRYNMPYLLYEADTCRVGDSIEVSPEPVHKALFPTDPEKYVEVLESMDCEECSYASDDDADYVLLVPFDTLRVMLRCDYDSSFYDHGRQPGESCWRDI